MPGNDEISFCLVKLYLSVMHVYQIMLRLNLLLYNTYNKICLLSD